MCKITKVLIISSKKTLAILLSFLMVAGPVGIDEIFGYEGYGIIPVSTRAQTQLTQTLEDFSLPPRLGQIAYQFAGSEDKTIVNIQDAHCNYSAQKSISRIIDYAHSEYNVTLVCPEGGAGDYDFSLFAGVDDPEIKGRIVDYFVESGFVNGAEEYALNKDNNTITYFGLEDPDLYIDNLSVYRSSLSYKKKVSDWIEALQKTATKIKVKIYSDELKKFDIKRIQYDKGDINIKEYLVYLFQKAFETNLNLNDYPHLERFIKVILSENKIKFKRANRERRYLIDQLTKTLPAYELKILTHKTLAYKNKDLTSEDFYKFLFRKAELASLSLDEYKELSKYAVYIKSYDEIDKSELFQDIHHLQADIADQLFVTNEEKYIYDASIKLSILSDMFNFRLIKDKYAQYDSEKELFRTEKILSIIQESSTKHDILFEVPGDIDLLDRYREEVSEFYSISLKRDDAFVRNIDEQFKEQNARSAVIITGGFHSENLRDLFRKKGYNYIEIRPAMKPAGDDNPYFDVLSGRVDSLTKTILNFENSNLAPWSLFTKIEKMVASGREEWMKLAISALQIRYQEGVQSQKWQEAIQAIQDAELSTPELVASGAEILPYEGEEKFVGRILGKEVNIKDRHFHVMSDEISQNGVEEITVTTDEGDKVIYYRKIAPKNEVEYMHEIVAAGDITADVVAVEDENILYMSYAGKIAVIDNKNFDKEKWIFTELGTTLRRLHEKVGLNMGWDLSQKHILVDRSKKTVRFVDFEMTRRIDPNDTTPLWDFSHVLSLLGNWYFVTDETNRREAIDLFSRAFFNDSREDGESLYGELSLEQKWYYKTYGTQLSQISDNTPVKLRYGLPVKLSSGAESLQTILYSSRDAEFAPGQKQGLFYLQEEDSLTAENVHWVSTTEVVAGLVSEIVTRYDADSSTMQDGINLIDGRTKIDRGPLSRDESSEDLYFEVGSQANIVVPSNLTTRENVSPTDLLDYLFSLSYLATDLTDIYADATGSTEERAHLSNIKRGVLSGILRGLIKKEMTLIESTDDAVPSAEDIAEARYLAFQKTDRLLRPYIREMMNNPSKENMFFTQDDIAQFLRFQIQPFTTYNARTLYNDPFVGWAEGRVVDMREGWTLDEAATAYWQKEWEGDVSLGQGVATSEYEIKKYAYVLGRFRSTREDASEEVLEIGSGNLSFAKEFIAEFDDVTYFAQDLGDMNPSTTPGLESVNYTQSQDSKINLDNRSVDRIISIDTLQHQNMDESTSEMHRVLKDRGQAILVIPHSRSEDISQTYKKNYNISLAAYRFLSYLRLLVADGRVDPIIHLANNPRNLGQDQLGPLTENIQTLLNAAKELTEGTKAEILSFIDDEVRDLAIRLKTQENMFKNLDLFPDTQSIEEYFTSRGFNANVTPINNDAGEPLAYGITLTKQEAPVSSGMEIDGIEFISNLSSQADAMDDLISALREKRVIPTVFVPDRHGNVTGTKALVDYVSRKKGWRGAWKYWADPEPKFVFLGDYTDRGYDAQNGSLKLINFFKEHGDSLLSEENAVFLLGNHDLFFMRSIDGSTVTMDNYDPLRAWVANGGLRVLEEANQGNDLLKDALDPFLDVESKHRNEKRELRQKRIEAEQEMKEAKEALDLAKEGADQDAIQAAEAKHQELSLKHDEAKSKDGKHPKLFDVLFDTYYDNHPERYHALHKAIQEHKSATGLEDALNWMRKRVKLYHMTQGFMGLHVGTVPVAHGINVWPLYPKEELDALEGSIRQMLEAPNFLLGDGLDVAEALEKSHSPIWDRDSSQHMVKDDHGLAFSQSAALWGPGLIATVGGHDKQPTVLADESDLTTWMLEGRGALRLSNRGLEVLAFRPKAFGRYGTKVTKKIDRKTFIKRLEAKRDFIKRRVATLKGESDGLRPEEQVVVMYERRFRRKGMAFNRLAAQAEEYSQTQTLADLRQARAEMLADKADDPDATVASHEGIDEYEFFIEYYKAKHPEVEDNIPTTISIGSVNYPKTHSIPAIDIDISLDLMPANDWQRLKNYLREIVIINLFYGSPQNFVPNFQLIAEILDINIHGFTNNSAWDISQALYWESDQFILDATHNKDGDLDNFYANPSIQVPDIIKSLQELVYFKDVQQLELRSAAQIQAIVSSIRQASIVSSGAEGEQLTMDDLEFSFYSELNDQQKRDLEPLMNQYKREFTKDETKFWEAPDYEDAFIAYHIAHHKRIPVSIQSFRKHNLESKFISTIGIVADQKRARGAAYLLREELFDRWARQGYWSVSITVRANSTNSSAHRFHNRMSNNPEYGSAIDYDPPDIRFDGEERDGIFRVNLVLWKILRSGEQSSQIERMRDISSRNKDNVAVHILEQFASDADYAVLLEKHRRDGAEDLLNNDEYFLTELIETMRRRYRLRLEVLEGNDGAATLAVSLPNVGKIGQNDQYVTYRLDQAGEAITSQELSGVLSKLILRNEEAQIFGYDQAISTLLLDEENRESQKEIIRLLTRLAQKSDVIAKQIWDEFFVVLEEDFTKENNYDDETIELAEELRRVISNQLRTDPITINQVDSFAGDISAVASGSEMLQKLPRAFAITASLFMTSFSAVDAPNTIDQSEHFNRVQLAGEVRRRDEKSYEDEQNELRGLKGAMDDFDPITRHISSGAESEADRRHQAWQENFLTKGDGFFHETTPSGLFDIVTKSNGNLHDFLWVSNQLKWANASGQGRDPNLPSLVENPLLEFDIDRIRQVIRDKESADPDLGERHILNSVEENIGWLRSSIPLTALTYESKVSIANTLLNLGRTYSQYAITPEQIIGVIGGEDRDRLAEWFKRGANRLDLNQHLTWGGIGKYNPDSLWAYVSQHALDNQLVSDIDPSVPMHTKWVLLNFEKFDLWYDLPHIRGFNLRSLMRLALVLHDIGWREGMSKEQHAMTIPIVKQFLVDHQFSEREMHFVTAIIDGDPIGKLLQNITTDPNEAAREIRRMHAQSGITSIGNFYEILKIFYIADASARANAFDVFRSIPRGSLSGGDADFVTSQDRRVIDPAIPSIKTLEDIMAGRLPDARLSVVSKDGESTQAILQQSFAINADTTVSIQIGRNQPLISSTVGEGVHFSIYGTGVNFHLTIEGFRGSFDSDQGKSLVMRFVVDNNETEIVPISALEKARSIHFGKDNRGSDIQILFPKDHSPSDRHLLDRISRDSFILRHSLAGIRIMPASGARTLQSFDPDSSSQWVSSGAETHLTNHRKSTMRRDMAIEFSRTIKASRDSKRFYSREQFIGGLNKHIRRSLEPHQQKFYDELAFTSTTLENMVIKDAGDWKDEAEFKAIYQDQVLSRDRIPEERKKVVESTLDELKAKSGSDDFKEITTAELLKAVNESIASQGLGDVLVMTSDQQRKVLGTIDLDSQYPGIVKKRSGSSVVPNAEIDKALIGADGNDGLLNAEDNWWKGKTTQQIADRVIEIVYPKGLSDDALRTKIRRSVHGKLTSKRFERYRSDLNIQAKGAAVRIPKKSWLALIARLEKHEEDLKDNPDKEITKASLNKELKLGRSIEWMLSKLAEDGYGDINPERGAALVGLITVTDVSEKTEENNILAELLRAEKERRERAQESDETFEAQHTYETLREAIAARTGKEIPPAFVRNTLERWADPSEANKKTSAYKEFGDYRDYIHIGQPISDLRRELDKIVKGEREKVAQAKERGELYEPVYTYEILKDELEKNMGVPSGSLSLKSVREYIRVNYVDYEDFIIRLSKKRPIIIQVLHNTLSSNLLNITNPDPDYLPSLDDLYAEFDKNIEAAGLAKGSETREQFRQMIIGRNDTHYYRVKMGYKSEPISTQDIYFALLPQVLTRMREERVGVRVTRNRVSTTQTEIISYFTIALYNLSDPKRKGYRDELTVDTGTLSEYVTRATEFVFPSLASAESENLTAEISNQAVLRRVFGTKDDPDSALIKDLRARLPGKEINPRELIGEAKKTSEVTKEKFDFMADQSVIDGDESAGISIHSLPPDLAAMYLEQISSIWDHLDRWQAVVLEHDQDPSNYTNSPEDDYRIFKAKIDQREAGTFDRIVGELNLPGDSNPLVTNVGLRKAAEEAQNKLLLEILQEQFGGGEVSSGAEAYEEDPQFEDYLKANNLDNYAALKPLLYSIKDTLLGDPSVRPVFVRRLSESDGNIGPLQIINNDRLNEFGGEELLENLSVFQVGNMELAESLAKEDKALIGVVDRETTLSKTVGNNSLVAGGRTAHFPVYNSENKRAGWISVKGLGQNNDPDKELFYQMGEPEENDYEGLVTISRFTEDVLRQIVRLTDYGHLFATPLGYRELYRVFDRSGEAVTVPEGSGLIFTWSPDPHRVSKLPQLVEGDHQLANIRQRLTEALYHAGVRATSELITNVELFSTMAHNFGSQEAIFQNLGIGKMSYSLQDMNIWPIEEDDSDEVLSFDDYLIDQKQEFQSFELDDIRVRVMEDTGINVLGLNRKLSELVILIHTLTKDEVKANLDLTGISDTTNSSDVAKKLVDIFLTAYFSDVELSPDQLALLRDPESEAVSAILFNLGKPVLEAIGINVNDLANLISEKAQSVSSGQENVIKADQFVSETKDRLKIRAGNNLSVNDLTALALKDHLPLIADLLSNFYANIDGHVYVFSTDRLDGESMGIHGSKLFSARQKAENVAERKLRKYKREAQALEYTLGFEEAESMLLKDVIPKIVEMIKVGRASKEEIRSKFAIAFSEDIYNQVINSKKIKQAILEATGNEIGDVGEFLNEYTMIHLAVGEERPLAPDLSIMMLLSRLNLQHAINAKSGVNDQLTRFAQILAKLTNQDADKLGALLWKEWTQVAENEDPQFLTKILEFELPPVERIEGEDVINEFKTAVEILTSL